MFRKLYWVTEHVDRHGYSKVNGVYTSIPDLLRHGLQRSADVSLRLTLTKLDSDQRPIGTWVSPGYEGIADVLQEFVRTEEFSSEQCNALLESLYGRQRAAV